jgi:hypothetical protein
MRGLHTVSLLVSELCYVFRIISLLCTWNFKLCLLSEFNCFCIDLVVFGLQALVIVLEPSEIEE